LILSERELRERGRQIVAQQLRKKAPFLTGRKLRTLAHEIEREQWAERDKEAVYRLTHGR
jgi:hypothetical protein